MLSHNDTQSDCLALDLMMRQNDGMPTDDACALMWCTLLLLK